MYFLYVGFRELVNTANNYGGGRFVEGGPRRGGCGRYRKSRMLYTLYTYYKCSVRCTVYTLNHYSIMVSENN